MPSVKVPVMSVLAKMTQLCCLHVEITDMPLDDLLNFIHCLASLPLLSRLTLRGQNIAAALSEALARVCRPGQTVAQDTEDEV